MDGKLKDIPTSTSAGIGLGSDISSLKENGTASVAELREFLKSLKARNPQEVIGIVSSSLLLQSLIMSCVITAIFMAVFTAGPYFVYGPAKPKTAAAKPNSNQASRPASEGAAPAESSTPSASSANSGPDVEKASKAMGLDESKPADPKRNPLDKPEIDKLLDGL